MNNVTQPARMSNARKEAKRRGQEEFGVNSEDEESPEEDEMVEDEEEEEVANP